MAEIVSLGHTLRRWRTQILAYHAMGASNGLTEAMNLLVKKIKRCGHGFKNFGNTGRVSSCTAVGSNGTLIPPRQCGGAHPGWLRRARLARGRQRVRHISQSPSELACRSWSSMPTADQPFVWLSFLW